ncbi:acyltransferase family protein [Cohnella thailandensis]|uniref:Acetyltransferase n=1 Tax=Cohnella thailandensis TaxID=557557 RepID=A0A841SXA0_9BACL|nr:acyltransferase family protein [Cohnella thailandensis]MBB6636873.1 acetyltransferase [Cohnella thailandensis]MBP1973247.1 peptidoglycan/LPS O-acetylase OafA/YrhL/lysophospholipase L1-like esterase [Cohnella thailandensis]
MPEQTGKKRYMPGLDGLRALSVMAVIVYHLPMNVLPGGFLGVGVFFVLSGYLITDQLVAKWQSERTLDLKGFWLRRARRLLPAMLLLVAIVAAWLAATDSSRLHSLGGDIGAALAYIHNWWLIFHNVSYFESFGPPSPFGHFWSLAVEEQFYVLWPLLLALGLTMAPKRGPLALIIGGCAALSALAMALIYVPGTDPSRVYYGTDTRAFGLLIGAALAVILPSASLKPILSNRRRLLVDGIGLAALAVIVLMAMYTDEYGAFTYRGGLLLLSIVTAVLIAVLIHPSSRLAQALSVKPLRWIGVRSYGIYLWHYPVIVLTSGSYLSGEVDYARTAMQIVLTLSLAALSWKFVEKPILNGGFGRLAHRTREALLAAKRGSVLRFRPRVFSMVSVSLVVVLCISCGGGGEARPSYANEAADPIINDINKTDPTPTPSATTKPDKDVILASGKNPSSASSSSKPAEVKPADETTEPAASGGNGKSEAAPSANAAADGNGVTVIGDSVILGVQSLLEEKLPGILVDGKVGRQMNKAMDTVEALEQEGNLGKVVVLELGTNGSFAEKKITQILDKLGEKRSVILINTRVPRQWQDTVNETLKDVAADYDNVTLIDWYRVSSGKKEYFGKDGVHLTRTGAELYADLIVKELKSVRGES